MTDRVAVLLLTMDAELADRLPPADPPVLGRLWAAARRAVDEPPAEALEVSPRPIEIVEARPREARIRFSLD